MKGVGIGKAIVERLVSEGATVIIHHNKSQVESVNLAKRMREIGEVITIRADLSKLTQIRTMFDDIESRFKAIQILVNNAGVFIGRPLLQTTEEDWDYMVAVNLKATYFCTQFAVKMMVPTGYGRIVNVASMDAFVAETNASVYCGTKGAIVSITHELAMELGKDGIRINAVAPGWIDTKMSEDAFADADYRSRLLSRIPSRRFGLPKDVASAVAFLCSNDSDYVNGSILLVDGGYTSA